MSGLFKILVNNFLIKRCYILYTGLRVFTLIGTKGQTKFFFFSDYCFRLS